MFSTENPGHQNNAGFSQATSQRPPRGASFNADEDYLFISAWLNTSLDAIHGNEQKEQTFWGKIHDYYHKFKTFDSDRSQLMLSQRWRRLQWKVNKYSGCVAAIYAKNESGKTEQDKVNYTQSVSYLKSILMFRLHMQKSCIYVCAMFRLQMQKSCMKHKKILNGTLIMLGIC